MFVHFLSSQSMNAVGQWLHAGSKQDELFSQRKDLLPNRFIVPVSSIQTSVERALLRWV